MEYDESANVRFSDDEKLVIDALENESGINFNEIQKRTKINSERLAEILNRFAALGIIVETKAKGTLHIENEDKKIIIEVYDKNPLLQSEDL